MNSYKRTTLKERLKRKIAQRDRLEESSDANLDNPKKSASMDTGDGRISYTNRSLESISKAISTLDAEIDLLQRKLYGGATVSFGLRRREYGY
jgi:hypothetical protein